MPLRFVDLDARIREGVGQVAAAEADPRDPLAGLYVSDEQALSLAADDPPAHVDERLAQLARLLGLDELEQAVLAVCAAPEVSWRYGRLYGYLHDDMTRQLASPRLAGALLAGGTVAGEDVLRCLAAEGTLRRSGAVTMLEEPRLALAERPLKCADLIAAALIGAGLADSRPAMCEVVSVPSLAPAAAPVIDELRGALAAGSELTLALAGQDAPAALAFALGRELLLASAAGLVDATALAGARLAAILCGRVLAFCGLERLQPAQRDAALALLDAESERTLVCIESADDGAVLGGRPALLVRIPALGLPERRAAWSAFAQGGDVGDVAVKFRLSLTQIEHAAAIARASARARGADVPDARDLDGGARRASRHGLAGLASRVDGQGGWDGLVVPERALRSLRTISAFLRHRDSVLWSGAAAARRRRRRG